MVEMKTQTQRITTLTELNNIAQGILSLCMREEDKKIATVLGLSGDLGAGKTAFTKELAKALEMKHEITSPTFVIMKSYPISANKKYTHLIHIDAYRIESDDEMRVLGLEEILNDPTKLVCIEWPEKIQGVLPRDIHNVTFVLHSDGMRDVAYDI